MKRGVSTAATHATRLGQVCLVLGGARIYFEPEQAMDLGNDLIAMACRAQRRDRRRVSTETKAKLDEAWQALRRGG